MAVALKLVPALNSKGKAINLTPGLNLEIMELNWPRFRADVEFNSVE